jgi:hypothetical protein
MSTVRRKQVELEEEILENVSLEILRPFLEVDRGNEQGWGRAEGVWIPLVKMRSLRRNRNLCLEEVEIAERTGKSVGGQEATEVTIGDTEALLEIGARMAKTDEDGIGHGQHLPGNTESKRIEIVKGHQGGNGRDLLRQIKHEGSRIDLSGKNPSPNQTNQRRMSRKQKQRHRRVIIQIL